MPTAADPLDGPIDVSDEPKPSRTPHAAEKSARSSGRSLLTGRGWFPQRFGGSGRNNQKEHAPSMNSADAASQDGEGCRPLAAFDAAAPDEGESDWAYALRWSRPADAATVFAAMQAADELSPHVHGATSDGLQGGYKKEHVRSASLTRSLGDASALAAGARRAVGFPRGRVVPENACAAANATAAAGDAGGTAPTLATTTATTAAAGDAAGASGGTSGTAAAVAATAAPPVPVVVTQPKRRFNMHRRSMST